MDLHFLLRNGISGGVFILFFFVGAGIATNGYWALLNPLLESFNKNTWEVTFLAASTPVIGIALQGIYLLFLQEFNWMFEDDARRFVAEKICETINNRGAWPAICQTKLEDYEQDPIFVAFYYSHAPAHLVEWARRRRSYHYLGCTVNIGAVLGLCVGVSWVAWVSEVSWKNIGDPIVLLILVGTIAAVVSAYILSKRMQRDVDQMEAIWALAHIDPRIGHSMGIAKPKPKSGILPAHQDLPGTVGFKILRSNEP